MSQILARTANSLFPAIGGQVRNVKFFLGGARCVTADQLAEQVDRAEAQIRAGVASTVTDVDNYRAA